MKPHIGLTFAALLSLTTGCLDQLDTDDLGEDDSELTIGADPGSPPGGVFDPDEPDGVDLIPKMVSGGCPVGLGGWGTFRVWNRGTMPAPASTVTVRQTYRHLTYNTTTTVTKTFKIAALAPGASATVGVINSATETLRFINYVQGSYKPTDWKITVDATAATAEINESNNVLASSFWCGG